MRPQPPRRLQQSQQGIGFVRVVDGHGEVLAGGLDELETTGHSSRFSQSRADQIEIDTECLADRDRGQGVVYRVVTEMAKSELST